LSATPSPHGARAHLGHLREDLLFLPGKALDRLDQVGNQVVATLELHIDAGPRLILHGPLADKLVVDRDEPDDNENDDDQSNDPAHVFLPLLAVDVPCHPAEQGAMHIVKETAQLQQGGADGPDSR